MQDRARPISCRPPATRANAILAHGRVADDLHGVSDTQNALPVIEVEILGGAGLNEQLLAECAATREPMELVECDLRRRRGRERGVHCALLDGDSDGVDVRAAGGRCRRDGAVLGAAGEAVELAFYAPNGTVVAVDCVLDEAGAATARAKDEGSGCV